MELQIGDIIGKHTRGTGLFSWYFCWKVRRVTRSEWNHTANYVGDVTLDASLAKRMNELNKKYHLRREPYYEGELLKRQMTEALGRGVVMRPVSIYEGRRRSFYCRAFRPYCTDEIKERARLTWLDDVGKEYDVKGLFGIMRAIRAYNLDRQNELEEADRLFCSEHTTRGYKTAGHALFNFGTIHPSNGAPGDCFIGPGKWI